MAARAKRARLTSIGCGCLEVYRFCCRRTGGYVQCQGAKRGYGGVIIRVIRVGAKGVRARSNWRKTGSERAARRGTVHVRIAPSILDLNDHPRDVFFAHDGVGGSINRPVYHE